MFLTEISFGSFNFAHMPPFFRWTPAGGGVAVDRDILLLLLLLLLLAFRDADAFFNVCWKTPKVKNRLNRCVAVSQSDESLPNNLSLH